MLTILNDPSGVSGGQRYLLDYTISLQENIAKHLEAGGGCTLRINGKDVDPLTDPRLDVPPGPSDLVTVTRRPEGYLEIIYYVVMVALIAYSYMSMPDRPRTDASAGNDSPNNKLTAQSNVARAYQGIPDVYGHRRVWPDLIQPSTVEYINNVKMVTEWMCISRGRGGIADVQYAESAIEDISESSYEVFEPTVVDGYPENGITTLLDVYEPAPSDDVNGQELPYATPGTTVPGTADLTSVIGAETFTLKLADGGYLATIKALAGTGTAQVTFHYNLGSNLFDEPCLVIGFVVAGPDVTFTFGSSAWASSNVEGSLAVDMAPLTLTTIGPFTLPVDCERIWWNTVFLRGLIGTVVIRADLWQIDGGGVEIPGTRAAEFLRFTGGSYDQLYFTTKRTPAAGLGRYRIAFTRQSLQVDDQAADVAKLEEVYAVRYHATKELPGVTVLRVTTKATLAATGFQDRKFNLYWDRHVRTLTSDALSPSRNFARSIAHIWTLAGNDISELDTDALAAINAEHGEDSPLLRFDGSLDDADMSLGDRMQLVAFTARCMVWFDGLQWTAARDQVRVDVPEMQLDYRNLAGSGESVQNFASHLPASFDGVELEYVDETSQAKKAYRRKNISSGEVVDGISSNPRKIQMPGCTTYAQAENRAQLEARRLIYQRTSVSDEALSDAGALGLLSVVRWIDPHDFGGDDLQAGEVMSIVGLVITTSEPLDWKGDTSGRILFTGVDGRPLGPPILCYSSGAAVLLASLPDGLYVADADRQCGSRYAFGVGLTEDEIESAGLYSVTEVLPTAERTFSLALASYDARMYAFD